MKIAVIGAGYWGKNLVRNFYELGVLKTVSDAGNDTREEMESRFNGIQTEPELENVLADSEIKGIVIATPAEMHYSMAKKALLAGKDVYVEKPLSLDYDQGKELVDLANRNKRILFVGHILQYHSAAAKMKQLINQGSIGRIEYIYSNRLSFGKIRREENILWSFAPHDISLILSLTGEEPVFIDAVGSNFLHPLIADVTMTNLKFQNGISAHIFVSWLNPFKEQRLVVVGSQGMLVFEDTLPLEKKLVLYPHIINWKNGIPCPEKAEGVPVDISAEWEEPLKKECKAFLHAMESREKPLTSGEEGLTVLKVLQACQASIEEKQEQLFKKSDPLPSFTDKYFAHETAAIDEGALIGENTKIWHYSHVMKGASIGKNCNLGQNVNVDKDTIIGNNVKIQNNVSVYSGVVVEDDVFLGPSCVLTNISNPRSEIKRQSLYERTLIRRGATIGANSTIVCGVTVGRYAFVAAGSVVTRDIPDYALVMGNPARQRGWMSRHGNKLEHRDELGYYICPESGYRYKEKDGILSCIDLSEEEELPVSQKTGTISYREWKQKEIK